MRKISIIGFCFLLISLGACSSMLIGDFLKILDEPEKFHNGLAKTKLTTEEYGRLVQDYYKTQDKDSTYTSFKNSYKAIQDLNNKLVNDIAIKIKNNVKVEYNDYEPRIKVVEKNLDDFIAKYTSEVTGLSSADLDPIITKVGLEIIKRLAKNQALKYYSNEFIKEYSINAFDELQI